MSALALLNHALNFLAPALWLALVLPLAGRFLIRKKSRAPAFGVQLVVNFAVSLLALAVGLWFFGRDGKMATYLAMTIACATGQWLMLRGWRG